VEIQLDLNKLKNRVFILNGMATCGKNTFVDLISKFHNTVHYSIVDPVRDILSDIGIDLNKKDERLRKLTSDIKLALEEYNNYPFEQVRLFLKDFEKNSKGDEIVFIDMREEHNIQQAIKEFGAQVVFVRNDRVHTINSNVADKNVFNTTSDYIIENNGSIKDLEKKALAFIKYIVIGCEKEECDLKCLECGHVYDDDEGLYCNLV